MELRTIKQLLHDEQADKNLLFKFGLVGVTAITAYQLTQEYANDRYLLMILLLYFVSRFIIRPVFARYKMLQAFDSLAFAHERLVADTEANLNASLQRHGFSLPPRHCPEELRPMNPTTKYHLLNSLPLLDLKAFDIRHRWKSIYHRLYQRHQLVQRLYLFHLRRLDVAGADLPVSHTTIESIGKLLEDYRMESPQLFRDPDYLGENPHFRDEDVYDNFLDYLNMLDYQQHDQEAST